MPHLRRAALWLSLGLIFCAPSLASAQGIFGPTSFATASAPISVSTGTTTELVAAQTGAAIYVTAFDFIAGGTDNVTLEYGTKASTACDTGATALTGAYPLIANFGISKGTGLGPILFVPPGKELCIVTSAGVQLSGSVSYAKF